MSTVEMLSEREWADLLEGIAVRPTREAVDWLVPGLIHPGITVVTGQPERGKTTLLTTLCAAAIQGTQWLGRPIQFSRDCGILFLAEDDSSVGLVTRSLAKVDPEQRVQIWRVEQWEETVDFRPVVAKGNLGLVIVDSAYGAAGDVNDQARANVFISSIQTIGVPVVVVHHEPKTIGNLPAGAQRFRAAYRHSLRIRSLRPLEAGQVNLEIEVSGNDVPGTSRLDVVLDRTSLATSVVESRTKPSRRTTPERPSRQQQARLVGRLARDAAVAAGSTHTEIATVLLGGGRGNEQPTAQATIAALGVRSIGHQALANLIKAERAAFDIGYREGSGDE